MIAKIAELLKPGIEALSWADKVFGVVVPISAKNKLGETKIIPAYLNSIDLCHASEYWDCVPDSSKMSIVYFEDQGMSVVNAGCHFMDCEATLRIIVWLNFKLINPQYTSSLLMKAELINAIPKRLTNDDYVTKICLWMDSEEQRSPAIFSRYSYDETQLQYLMWPYDYFALNYRVKFSIPLSACETVQLNPSIC